MRLVAAVVLLLVFLPLVHAQDIGVDVRPVKDAISAGDTALFSVTVANNLNQDDSFVLRFSNDVEWTILTDPLSYRLSAFPLAQGESTTFMVKLRASPNAALNYNQYVVAMTVSGKDSGKSAQALLNLGYGPQFLSPRDYAALVVASAEVPQHVDPRQEYKIVVHLKNKNPLNISGLDLHVSSTLVDQRISLPLGPLEVRTLAFTQELNPLESPGPGVVVITVSRQNETMVQLERTYDIIGYSTLEHSATVSESALSRTTVTRYFNNGNHEITQEVALPLTFAERLFATTSPRALAYRDDKSVYSITLGPAESKIITLSVSYLPLAFIGCAIILFALGYYLFRSPVEVKKDAMVVAKHEGGLAGLKIMLTVKNRSMFTVKDVKIADSVPNIADIDRQFDPGILEPTRYIRHAGKGTIMKWDLGELEPGEERVLTYKVKARLTILGSFTLPAAIAKGLRGARIFLGYSNRLRMMF